MSANASDVAEKFAIEHFSEYPLRRSDLNHLDDDCIAALGVASFAVSELNVLSRAFISTWHADTGDSIIDQLASAQRLTILRVWSSKLFEFVEFLSLSGKHNKTSSPTLLAAFEHIRPNLEQLKSSRAYEFARAVRNEAAHHYTLSAARKNLKYLPNNSNLSLYVHKMRGNAFYPMGEEIMFFSRLNRFIDGSDDEKDIQGFFKNWLDWKIDANNLVNKIQFILVRDLIIDYHPKKFARKKTFWLPYSMIGRISGPFLPLFFRRDDD